LIEFTNHKGGFMLSKIYDQYKTKFNLSLGSRVYDFYGRYVIRTPLHKFSKMNPHLEREYYYNVGDRASTEAIKESESNWRDQSLLLAQVRDEEAPRVSRAVFYTSILLIGLLGVAFWVVIHLNN